MSDDRPKNLRELARRTDSRPRVVETARFVRRLLPGDRDYGDALTTSGDELTHQLGRLLRETRTERPSAIRELGLGALQAWQALSEAQRRGRGTADVAILFTDLVGFSSWALEAGDDSALEVLRRVGDQEDAAVSANGGTVVKRLGDGVMAAFSHPQKAVDAALDLREGLAQITVNGYTPTARAGVHVGRPRKIGGDYLGVDVNIAARIGAAAREGEVLVSESAKSRLDAAAYSFGRARRLKASGVPKQLSVCPIDREG